MTIRRLADRRPPLLPQKGGGDPQRSILSNGANQQQLAVTPGGRCCLPPFGRGTVRQKQGPGSPPRAPEPQYNLRKPIPSLPQPICDFPLRPPHGSGSLGTEGSSAACLGPPCPGTSPPRPYAAPVSTALMATGDVQATRMDGLARPSASAGCIPTDQLNASFRTVEKLPFLSPVEREYCYLWSWKLQRRKGSVPTGLRAQRPRLQAPGTQPPGHLI